MIDEIKLEEEKIKENLQKQKEKIQSKIVIEDPVVKITFKRILAYFIIYSFLGFIIETIFGMLTKGVIESRQSCLYGPFCCIYGLGAAVMIPGLQKFKKKNWTLFLAGAIEGSIVEYVISWLGEIVFHIKWWDYSNMPFDINGRICLLFTIFWGILALVLMRLINPYIEKFIDKIPKKLFSVLTIGGTILLILDLLITAFGLQVFYTRFTKKYDLNLVEDKNLMVSQEVLENKFVQKLSNTIFTDEKMLRTFPNIKYKDNDGNIIWVKDILTDIKPYYYKISHKFRLK
ncbi:MAG: putative ABC transporter permease [Clostridium sp.]|nr:putative ABC transporter permease [Clostridium sp.]